MIQLAFLEFFLAIAAMIIAPRAAVVSLLAIGVVAGGAVFVARSSLGCLAPDLRAWSRALAPLAMLALLAAGSALWSPVPVQSLSSGLALLALLAIAVTIILSERVTLAPVARACLWGFLAAFILGLVISVVEVLTDQGIMRWVIARIPALQQDIGKHTFMSDGLVTALSEATANRRTAILTLLFLPALLMIHAFWSGTHGLAVAAGLSMLSVIAIYGSEHQSSQLAFFVAIGVFVVAGFSYRLAARFVLGGWFVATILILPIVLLLETAGWHRASSLPESARQRVVIWSTTARETLRAPILGIGAEATPAAPGYRLVKAVTPGATTSVHAHNAYLQTWYELGAAGAVLLLVAGFVGLRTIDRVQNPLHRRFALAQFTMGASMIATSYGIWQPWFLSALALSMVICALALRANGRPPAHATPKELEKADE